MPDPDDGESEASGAQQRQAWFLGQRAVAMTPKDPAKDVEDEIDLPDPVDPSEQLPGAPPALADQMREYRLRLQDAADAD
jgi:hypothetical protein